jgi:hypothetical protein
MPSSSFGRKGTDDRLRGCSFWAENAGLLKLVMFNPIAKGSAIFLGELIYCDLS